MNTDEQIGGIELSNNLIIENADKNLVVASLTTFGFDNSENFKYELMSEQSEDDSILFSIIDDQLVFNASSNYEEKSSYDLKIKSIQEGKITLSTDDRNIFALNTEISDASDNVPTRRPVWKDLQIQLDLRGLRIISDNSSSEAYGVYSGASVLGTEENDLLSIEVSNGNVRVGVQGEINLQSGDDFLQIDTGSGNEYAVLDGYIDLGEGNDQALLSGCTCSSQLEGGDGNDKITLSGGYLSASDSLIELGEGNDYIYSRSRMGYDSIHNFENTSIVGSSGDDFFNIMLGSGFVDGGEGFDVFILDITDTEYSITSTSSFKNKDIDGFNIHLSSQDRIKIKEGLNLGEWQIFYNGNTLEMSDIEEIIITDSDSIPLIINREESIVLEQNFTISVDDINEAPYDLKFSDLAFDENIPDNSVIATLFSDDEDLDDFHAYSLVSGNGDEDNSDFIIDGDQLIIVDTPDFENKSSYSVRVQTEDFGGLTFEESFTLTVNDLEEDPLDLDGDGFVDTVTNYQMWTVFGGVDLQSRRGKTYSDDTSRKWDAVKAVETNSGFSVLVEGQRNKDGKFKVATANEEGVISGATRWLNGNQMFNEGYEDLFAMDFNGNSDIGI